LAPASGDSAEVVTAEKKNTDNATHAATADLLTILRIDAVMVPSLIRAWSVELGVLIQELKQ
jgi:hypothetical protein